MARLALFAAAALALAAAAAAQGTKGTTLRGYTFASDASGALGVSKDINEIKKLLNSKKPNYTAAKQIYMDGKNAKGHDGKVLSLRQLATGVPKGDPTYDLYTQYFRTPYFIDDVVARAFGGVKPFTKDEDRVQLIVKSLQSSLQFSIMMHLLESAAALAKAKKPDDAVKRVDEAWALFVGAEPDDGLFTVTMKRANEFGTKTSCQTSKASDAVLKAMIAAQKAAKAGDAKGVEAAALAARRAMSATFAQAIITYAHEVYLDQQAKMDGDGHQTEAYAFFRTIAPLVGKANLKSAQALDYWLFPANPATEPDVDLKAARALKDAYKGLGIAAADVGVYGRKQPELKCAAYQAAATPGGILTTTNAKDSLRPTAAPAAKAAAAPATAAADAGADADGPDADDGAAMDSDAMAEKEGP